MAQKSICINGNFNKDFFYKKEIEFGVIVLREDILDIDGEAQYVEEDITKYYTLRKSPPRKRVNQEIIDTVSKYPNENPYWQEVTGNADIEFIKKYVPFKCSETFTSDKGSFVLDVDPRDIAQSPLPFLTPKIKIIKEGYLTKKIIPIKGDGSSLDDLGNINLIPKDKGKDQKKRSEKISKSKEVKTSSDKTNKNNAQINLLIKTQSDLKQKLIPILIDLAYEYGMVELDELVSLGQSAVLEFFEDEENFCPSPSTLSYLIKRKNDLTTTLNTIFSIVDTSTKILGVTGGIIELLGTAYETLRILPLPTSTGVPGVPGLPVSFINIIQDFKVKFNQTIIDLRKLNTDISSLLTLIRDTLLQCIQYLSLLDQAFAYCYPNSPSSIEKLNQSLLALTQAQTQQNTPPVPEVNGFEMSIEADNKTESLQRKRAVAKNKQGVTLLKGEWSYSSIDQILIDELVFYIQVNNLKAD
jgi:hypothetical protein